MASTPCGDVIRLRQSADDAAPGTAPPTNQVSFDVTSAYHSFGKELYLFALNALGDVQAAEEAMQETFTRAWKARRQYSPERASQRTWLYAIARNIIRDAFRRRSRIPEPVDESRWTHLAADQRDPAEHLMLIEALSLLSSEHRQAVLAIHVIGLNYAELSESIDVPISTLRSRTFHGLRALRRHINSAETADE